MTMFVTVYATTAANSDESSYACYFSNIYNTYLGDVYSVKWMEDSDAVCPSVYYFPHDPMHKCLKEHFHFKRTTF